MKELFKTIYDFIPFKKHLFTLLNSFYSPSQSVYKHLHFKDVIKVEVDNEHSFKINHYGLQVENEIFWNGLFNGWEKVSLRLWADLCQGSEVIFDVGANTGVYSLVAKSLEPKSKVYAVEPVSRVYSKLEENIQLNSYDIVGLELALSNYTGTATIYDKDTEHTYSVTVNKDLSPNKDSSFEVEIQTKRLDEIIEERSIPKIDLLKLDVETHEAEVLEGMGKYLKLFQPAMVIEILNDEVARAVQELIQGIDYVFYVIDENSGVKKVDSLRKSDYFNFLICTEEQLSKIGSLADLEKDYRSTNKS